MNSDENFQLLSSIPVQLEISFTVQEMIDFVQSSELYQVKIEKRKFTRTDEFSDKIIEFHRYIPVVQRYVQLEQDQTFEWQELTTPDETSYTRKMDVLFDTFNDLLKAKLLQQ